MGEAMAKHFFVREKGGEWTDIGPTDLLGIKGVGGHEAELCIILRDMMSADGREVEVELRPVES